MSRSFLILKEKKNLKTCEGSFFFSLFRSAWPWTLSSIAKLKKGTSKNTILLFQIILTVFWSKVLLYFDETNYRPFQLKKVILWKILALVIGKSIYSHGIDRQLLMLRGSDFCADPLPSIQPNYSYSLQGITILLLVYIGAHKPIFSLCLENK